MAHTIVTNYTDLNPSPKDNSLIVVFNKDGTINLDKETLQSLISQPPESTLLSFVRVNDDGKLEEHSDHSSDDGTTPHINLTVDAFFDHTEIFNEGSVEDLLAPLHIDTKEHFLEAFKNDHCYTPLVSPSQTLPSSETFDNTDLENDIISHSIAKPQIPTSKKITILEQQIIPKGKTLINVNSTDAKVILKGAEALRTSLSCFTSTNLVLTKPFIDKQLKIELKRHEVENKIKLNKNESTDSSSESATSDSDSDYKDSSDRKHIIKSKPKQPVKAVKHVISKKYVNKNANALNILTKPKKVLQSKISIKEAPPSIKPTIPNLNKRKYRKVGNKLSNPDSLITPKAIVESAKDKPKFDSKSELKVEIKPELKLETKPETPKVQKSVLKKEKKTPAHVTALLSDMTSLFSTPDVIRRVSADAKVHKNVDKQLPSHTMKILTADLPNKDLNTSAIDEKFVLKTNPKVKTYSTSDTKQYKTQVKENIRKLSTDKSLKELSEEIPQIDESALAHLFTTANASEVPSLPTTTGNATPGSVIIPKENVMLSPNAVNNVGFAGSLSPSLDLLTGLHPEDDDLSEDLLRHVAHLVENNEKLQEVIDKQVLGKATDTVEPKVIPTTAHASEPVLLNNTLTDVHVNDSMPQQFTSLTPVNQQKQPIQIIRSDGRVITLPPIEAPATRSSKRKGLNFVQTVPDNETPPPVIIDPSTPKLKVNTTQNTPKQYTHKKLVSKSTAPTTAHETMSEGTNDVAESDASWNSEDDPYRLWCICKQPHNNRFMICCDSCEDWFHGKCVNITKAMGHQMEEQGIEWNCPNCIKKKAQAAKIATVTPKNVSNRKTETPNKVAAGDGLPVPNVKSKANTTCIVCKKAARASSIYCSDVCILKHARVSNPTQPVTPPAASPKAPPRQPETTETASKSDRVIVYDRVTGTCFAGSKAPTAANLKTWLQQNPTFEVVRPGTLSAAPKPTPFLKSPVQKPKVQTTLKIGSQKQVILVSPPIKSPGTNVKEKLSKLESQESTPVKKEIAPQATPKPGTPKTPTNPKSLKAQSVKVPASKSLVTKGTANQHSPSMKSPPPSTNKRKEDYFKSRSESLESTKEITVQQRNTVKKSLQDQMTLRMADTVESKLSNEAIKKFVDETEMELFDLFNKDNAKYKAKYRSLVFNMGDKKNKSLWQKICDQSVTPKQLVRLSPEELASQELAQWRNKEAKHQLELIKKSELDLLTCTKTYVLKTHKGEEVMESRSTATTELDPNVAVEDLVTALNDPNGSVNTPTKLSSIENNRNQDRHKSSKHKSHKTSKKSKRDQPYGHKEDRHKSKDEIISHKHSSKHSSKNNSKNDDLKLRESRKSSHRDKHKVKLEIERKISKSKSQEKIDTLNKIDTVLSQTLTPHQHGKHRSKSRGRSKHRSSSRGRSKQRSSSRGRSKHRSSSRGRSKHRSFSRGRSKHRSSSRGQLKHRSPSTGRSKYRSSSRGRSKHRSHSRGRSKHRLHTTGQSKHRSRSGNRTITRSRSRTKYSIDLRSQSGDRHSNDHGKRRSYSKELDSSELSSSSKESRKRRMSKNDHERSLSQDSSDKSKSYLADAHPEYDPHVAMVTSALSEEDLRRSKDDSYDESSVNDVMESSLGYSLPHEEYDPAKSGNYNRITSTPFSTNAVDVKHRLSSGTESDQEPTSTVDSIPATVWNGCVNMVDVARFYVTAHEVSGNCSEIGQDLCSELDIVGRINPDTVWDYIVKMKKSGNKDILVLRLTAANDEERMQYIALYSYLSSRNRLGVVKVSNTISVKDFYIFPLSSHAPIPTVLLPLDGPGFEDIRPHLLVAVMIRQRRKRPHPEPTTPVVPQPKVSKMDAVSTSAFGKSASYTPPTSPRVSSIGSALPSLPALPLLSVLSSSVKDKIAASLAAADDDNEPYSPGGSDSSETYNPTAVVPPPLPPSLPLPPLTPANDDVLSRKLQELDRKIAEERKQIISISKNIQPSVGSDEPYSPSRPMTPPPPGAGAPLTTLSDISLPSNLQEILANIQKKSHPPPEESNREPPVLCPLKPVVADVDMRVMGVQPPLPPPDFSVPPPPFYPPNADSSVKGISKLSMLSEEELLSMVPADESIARPASELPFVPPLPPGAAPDSDGPNYLHSYRSLKLDLSQPPPPGLHDP